LNPAGVITMRSVQQKLRNVLRSYNEIDKMPKQFKLKAVRQIKPTQDTIAHRFISMLIKMQISLDSLFWSKK